MTAAEQAKTLYCMGCGEEVPTHQVEVTGGIEVRCSCCGFALEARQLVFEMMLDCIILADDELLFRTLLKDLLIEERVGNEVVACESGQAFLAECVRRFRDGRSISLVVLDILMAPIDGPAAGLGLRALEKGFDLHPPIPILFLSGLPADDALRKALQGTAPALYLNKGKDAAPPRLARRLKELVPHLLGATRPR